MSYFNYALYREYFHACSGFFEGGEVTGERVRQAPASQRKGEHDLAL